MEDAAREARNRYKREWYAKNREKQREYEHRYWTRLANIHRKETEETRNADTETEQGTAGVIDAA